MENLFYEIKTKIDETEEEFIYQTIFPFCEDVLEKRLSKEELKKILLMGQSLKTGYFKENLIKKIENCKFSKEDTETSFHLGFNCGINLAIDMINSYCK